jgi:uncharacterized protein
LHEGTNREGLLYFGFEDERLGGLSVASESERQRMVNPRKVYPIDMGLIPIYDAVGRSNLGHALETAVLLELERRGAEISYVRTASGFEVDFLARYPEGHRELIQVCADLDEPTTRTRETRALLDASREHRNASLHLISLAPEIPPDLPKTIRWHAASAWLLSQSPPTTRTRQPRKGARVKTR